MQKIHENHLFSLLLFSIVLQVVRGISGLACISRDLNYKDKTIAGIIFQFNKDDCFAPFTSIIVKNRSNGCFDVTLINTLIFPNTEKSFKKPDLISL